MEQYILFIMNHPFLVGTFAVLLTVLIVTETRRGGRSVSVQELTTLVNQEHAVIVDLRDKKEFGTGRITGAINIPLANLESRMGELDKHKSSPIILVDAMGQQAGSAGRQLRAAGFENVMRLNGGISSWKESSLPLVKS